MRKVSKDPVGYHMMVDHQSPNANGVSTRMVPKPGQTEEQLHEELHAKGGPFADHTHHEDDPKFNRNVSEKQFSRKKMMTPAEILSTHAVHHYEMTQSEKRMDEDSGTSAFWGRIAKENKKSGLAKDLKSGLKNPIVLAHGDHDYPEGYIYDGHHRLHALNEIAPHVKIPVVIKRAD